MRNERWLWALLVGCFVVGCAEEQVRRATPPDDLLRFDADAMCDVGPIFRKAGVTCIRGGS